MSESVSLRVVCISDTHGQHWRLDLPEGDVLVHAGDFTNMGRVGEVKDFLDWFGSIEGYQALIFIAGNHDFLAQRDPWAFRVWLPHTVTYLEDSGCGVGGVKFWGSPWTPRFGPWAFMRDRADLKTTWDRMPTDVDVLITHGPEHGIADRCVGGDLAGDPYLGLAISRRPSIQYHVHGHIHEGAGTYRADGHVTVNASVLDEAYRPKHAPTVIEVKTHARIA